MAIQYAVNIQITSGCDFRQEFYLTNPDLTPMNIKGAKFKAAVAKHPEAIDANLSESGNPVYQMLPMHTSVVDGYGGVYSIALSAAETSVLFEGKYVYNVIMIDQAGYKREVVSGLAFVERAFASVL